MLNPQITLSYDEFIALLFDVGMCIQQSGNWGRNGKVGFSNYVYELEMIYR